MSGTVVSVLKKQTVWQTLQGRHLLTLTDLGPEAVNDLIGLALDLKRARPDHGQPLAGKTLALIFMKPSTRTRVSFEVAMKELGGDSLFLHARDMQLDRGETLADTGAVMSRYVSGIVMRTSSHADLVELAANATVPIINALSDMFHPCQALADLLTLYETFGRLQGLRVAYVGDGNNVAHSLILGGAMTGVQIAVASPPGYEPDPRVIAQAKQIGGDNAVFVTHDPIAAVTGAHAVYTDVWTSMGDEDEAAVRNQVFAPYQVNAQLCAHADPDYIFMHCLPAHRELEVTSEILDGPHSRVLDQAENRLHAQKAVLLALLG